jgi:hypothetical protein
MNKYYLQARLFPTVLTAIPLFVLVNEVVVKFYGSKLQEVLSILPHLTSFSITAALLFLFVQINRIISKQIFQILYFRDELYMPTTTRLLWKDNNIETSIKTVLRNKIYEKFEIRLMTAVEEESNELNARKKVAFSVSQVRNSLRDNALLLQHNIEFGFMRNLLGGCIPAILFSVGIILFSNFVDNTVLRTEGYILLLLYFLPVLLSKWIITIYGNTYQKVLFEQFWESDRTSIGGINL